MKEINKESQNWIEKKFNFNLRLKIIKKQLSN